MDHPVLRDRGLRRGGVAEVSTNNSGVLVMLEELLTQLHLDPALNSAAMALHVEALTEFVELAKITLSDWESRLSQRMGEESLYEVKTPASTWVRQKRNDRKAWDHPRLAGLVAQRALEAREPDEDGVISDPGETVLQAILGTAGISYWRQRDLRRLGIDGDNYCDVTDGGYAVRRK